jgi:UDP-N-acetylmuramyl pentapeptide phosphotransferase/UDP-N-acetylglucosamine-1-phosphate transferase
MDLSNGTTVQFLFDAVVIAVVIWFWARRSRPTLVALHAEPLALRLGLLATIALVVVMGVHAIALAMGQDGLAASAVRLVGGFAWLVIVGVGHPEYRFLRYATGSRPPGADR